MRSPTRSAGRTARRRRSRAKVQPLAGTREFLRNTFYYLKGEQLLKVSGRLVFEAA